MAKIRPFKAVIYNLKKAGELARLTCPPYDVISAEKQVFFHNLNPYNFIKILFGLDVPGENKYERAAARFEQWLKKGILTREENPAIYYYSQEYSIRGEKKVRLGLICLLRLGDDKECALGHEHTRLQPKEDRLRLLKQVKANLSPIFAIFQDHKRIIQRTYNKRVKTFDPFISIVDDEKVAHKLWRLDSPEAISEIEAGFKNEDIFIADGHHRYEVACAYRDEMKQALKDDYTGDEDFNYILAYFTNTDSKGLSIFAIHRLLSLSKDLEIESFLKSAGEYFDIEEIKEKAKFFFMLERGGREHLLGMFHKEKFYLMRLRNIKIIDRLLGERNSAYRSLDVAILNHIVLEKILNIDVTGKDSLKYSANHEEFVQEAGKDPKAVAFFLNPVKVEQILQVASSGEKMPAKSTYFYPKVLSGLVINKHEEKF